MCLSHEFLRLELRVCSHFIYLEKHEPTLSVPVLRLIHLLLYVEYPAKWNCRSRKAGEFYMKFLLHLTL
jgi:hypothetical protein